MTNENEKENDIKSNLHELGKWNNSKENLIKEIQKKELILQTKDAIKKDLCLNAEENSMLELIGEC